MPALQEPLEREQPEHAEGGPDEAADEPKDGQPPAKPKRKRAKPGESENGPSFGRRTCPKTAPAKQRWEAIKTLFDRVIGPWMIALGFKKTQFEAWGGRKCELSNMFLFQCFASLALLDAIVFKVIFSVDPAFTIHGELQVEWLLFCQSKMTTENADVKTVTESLKNEGDVATIEAKYFEVFHGVARSMVHKFLLEKKLCTDESQLPSLEQC